MTQWYKLILISVSENDHRTYGILCIGFNGVILTT